MKQFLKDNAAIAAAIVLPLVLALIFFLSAMLTKMSVEDPKYDLLIATDYYDYNPQTLRLAVVDGRLEATYRMPEKDSQPQNTNIRLWRIRVKDMSVQEIALPRPPESGEPGTIVKLEVQDLKDTPLSATQPGPDGYRFEQSSYYNGSLMMELFSAEGRRGNGVLVNGSRVIDIRGLPHNYYNPVFIGWITDTQ